MGIYDRDYVRTEPGGFRVGNLSMIAKLIIANVAVCVVDQFTGNRDSGYWLSKVMAVRVDTLTHPLEWWRFLTYGFAHDPSDFGHILWNMLTLGFLGRIVESHYGQKEFLRLYLVMTVIAGVAWAVIERMAGAPSNAPMIGASGAIAGVVVLLALNYPRLQILLFFFLPVPAWLIGVMGVAKDLMGALDRSGNVAFTAHLAGAGFAAAYYFGHWRLGNLIPGNWSWTTVRQWKRRSKLRVHRPPTDDRRLADELDRILEKISKQGESSLTSAERRTLQDASKHYQQRTKRE